MNSKQSHRRFKRTTLALATSLYVGATGVIASEVSGTQSDASVRNHTFHIPSFTADDVHRFNEERDQALADAQQLLGHNQLGEPNRIYKKRSAKDIYDPELDSGEFDSYIVQLTEQAVSVYDGHIAGYEATRSANRGSLLADVKLNVKTAKVEQYSDFLIAKQNDFAAQAQQQGIKLDVEKQFTLATNAMVVSMSKGDAIAMSRMAGVSKITPNRLLELNTDRGPQFIGADQAWSGSVTPDGVGVKGEGMVVGIIDTGVNTDHEAFASDDDYSAVRGDDAGAFYGDCATDYPELCNDKLIGVYSYPEVTEANNYPASGSWRDRKPENGEDYNGHGSHVAGTTAGNTMTDVPLKVSAGEAVSDGIDVPFNFTEVSGVAPRAHIISYQVCMPGNSGDAYSGCPTSAILSAYEDAIKDGVDVINMSVGGGERFSWDDPIELALLSAREAGISVAVAAGNSGPNFYSVGHASPWVTTVGASTHDRVMDTGNKTIGGFSTEGIQSWKKPRVTEGKSYTGAITGPVVLASNYPDPDPSDGFDAGLCAAPFPAGTFTADQIVLCDRGENARVEKAQYVADGGAGGFILMNARAQWGQPPVATNVVADVYPIPGIHIAYDFNMHYWANNATDTTVTISDYTNTYEFDAEAGNNLAIFSSMGPSRFHDTLTPDVTAPGVAIYAPYADEQPFKQYPDARDWSFLQGTSMASPHVAGAMTLLEQMHPDWTPAQVQSALMMTANDVMLQMYYGRVETFYNFMAGAGAIDVAKASQAGLILDETIENYRNANPNNGGVANWLNLPSMVDMDCENSCSFMRKVTATIDGTWTAEGITNGYNADAGHEVTVTPSQFSLNAGESQDIIVKVTVPGIIENIIEPEDPGQDWKIDTNHELLNAQLILTEVDNKAPVSRMPIVVASVRDQLPTSMELDIHRNQGSETVWINTDNYSELTARSFGLAKPEETEFNLTGVRSASLAHSRVTGPGWHTYTIEVPEGTKALMVESLSVDTENTTVDANGKFKRFRPWLLVGQDFNGNGGFIPSESSQEIANELYEERVCDSTSSSMHNHCYIIDPEPGTYWVSAFGYTRYMDLTDVEYQVSVGHAFVTEDSDAGNMTISGPESHDGNGHYPIDLSWNLQDAAQGDVFFGGFDMGNMPGAEGTLGFTALKLARGKDAFTMQVSQDKARNMDIIDVSIELMANMESDDRDYDITLTMPEGMRIAPRTFKGNNDAIEQAVMIDENTMQLSGTQLTTRYVEAEYVMTTNLTSEQCHTPIIDEYSDGGYIDFADFRIPPNQTWFEGNYRNDFVVPMWWLTQGMQNNDFDIYNEKSDGIMKFNPAGAFQLVDSYWPMRTLTSMSNLIHAVSPMWVGSMEAEYHKQIIGGVKDYRGLTIAGQYASERPDIGDVLFLEFDDMRDVNTGERFDYEMILRAGVDDHEGMHEVIFAYDNLGSLPEGTLGLSGFKSPFLSNVGPADGFLKTQPFFGDLGEFLHDDLVICFDYQGPEQSEIKLNFKAVIQPEAVGKTVDIVVDYDLQGQGSAQVIRSIDVNSNIKVADMADMTVAEDGRIDGIEVMHIDTNAVDNALQVNGEHISAEIDGMSFNLIPDADFFGETEVTVSVYDMEHNSDSASATFMLTVTPEDDMPSVSFATDSIEIETGDSVTLSAMAIDVDGDELTYSWSGPGTMTDADTATPTISDLDEGNHTYEVTVSDDKHDVTASIDVSVVKKIKEKSADEEEEDDDSSSGSLFYLLLFLPLLARRAVWKK
ncbi:S8 family serine peptidase [Thalassotalea sp. Y01]|uniref:S8 family serine peptidase n=1 Tax=Thalassotalea sp. Y01 TaxID=2729613 RepID=UPI00145C81A7|nr:S8 family serine peptidase [Thalassotalea sp. Y01]NMP16425.1 S8 family serine peptidase [Thalassotalea sp. Y01]